MTETPSPAERVGAVLSGRGHHLAVAESLTGGLLASTFARAPRSSGWFLGGVVAYASEVKYRVLNVPEGPVVTRAAAEVMAGGVARLLGASVAVAVTGVGGPDPQDGQPPGTVWTATWPAELGEPVQLQLEGSPEDICADVCLRLPQLLLERLQRRS